jgi:GDPmannose 4,6-dehydratase
MKKAIITGITGQDGSYLAEFLLDKGYEVYGITRRSSTFNTERIDHLLEDIHAKNHKLFRLYGDLTDSGSISKIIYDVMPDEIYNLGAQSHVKISFDIPEYTADSVALGALRILEVIRNIKEKTGRSIKYYQASSSEMYGLVKETPQKEDTPFYPRSPYGCSKLFGYWISKNYREAYNLFICNGILFNHESPRRGRTFVTRKITEAVARIKAGVQEVLYLGNLEAKRDWGHAKDFVEAMWLMMQKEEPEDYVIATGETHSVREFLLEAFNVAGIKIVSNGKFGIEEQFIREDTGKIVVKIDPLYYRPTEVDLLLGDYEKARKFLNWKPKTNFKSLITEMVNEDIKMVREEINGKNGN